MTQFFRSKQNSRAERVKEALIKSFSTILWAAATTVGNFFTPVQALRDFGIVSSGATIAAGFAAVTLLPALLTLFGPKDIKVQESKPPAAFLYRWGDSLLSHRWLTFGISAAFVAVFIVGSFFVRSEYKMLGYFRKDSEVVRDARKISESFGGVLTFDVAIETPSPDGVKRADLLKAMDDVSENLKRNFPDDVRVTFSLADYVKEMNAAYNGSTQRQTHYQIPKDNDEVAQYLEIYSWSGDIEKDLAPVVDSSFQVARLAGRFQVQEKSEGEFFEHTIQKYQEMIEESLAPLRQVAGLSTVEQYGEIPLWSKTLADIVRSQVYSVSAAIFLVLFLARLGLRSSRLALICIIPVTISILGTFASMGIFAIRLDIATSLVAAIAAGVGIDNAIHFLMEMKERKKSEDLRHQVSENFQYCFTPIMTTTLALLIGYAPFLLSGFTPLVNFGILNMIAIVLASIATLGLLPQLIVLLWSKGLIKKSLSS